MPEKGQISQYQLFSIMVLFLFGSTVVLQSITAAGRASWISSVLGVLSGIALALVITALAKRFPGMTLIEYSQVLFGRFIGKIIGALYLWYFFHLATLVTRNFGELLSSAIMTETPIWFFHATLALMAGFLIYSQIEVMGRISEIFMPLTIFWSLTTSSLLHVSGVNRFEFLQPVLGPGIGNILKGAVPIAAVPYQEIILFTMIFPFLNNSAKTRKVTIGALALSGFFLTSILIQNIAIFGEYLATLTFPRFFATRLITVGEFIERIEPVVIAIWIMSGIIKIGLCMYAFVLGTSQLFGLKDYRHLVWPAAVLMAVQAGIVFETTFDMFNFTTNIYPIYAFPFQVLLPALMLIMAVFKQKKRGR